MNVVAIIQARMGSNRLPRKVLLKLYGKTILEHVVERVSCARRVEKVIVATTVKNEDSDIADLAMKAGYAMYRGSENDVLDRYYQSAKAYNVEHIVRITADCPVIDPQIIDSVVEYYFKNKADYGSNILDETFPDGEDVEVFSFETLEKAWQKAELPSDREHVTPYIRRNKRSFKLASYTNKVDLSGKRWTLDQEEDYRFLKEIFKKLYRSNPQFGMNDILKVLQECPHLENINNGIMRNQGYCKSVQREQFAKAKS